MTVIVAVAAALVLAVAASFAAVATRIARRRSEPARCVHLHDIAVSATAHASARSPEPVETPTLEGRTHVRVLAGADR